MAARTFGNIPLSIQSDLLNRGIRIEDYIREQHAKKLRSLKSAIRAIPNIKRWSQRASKSAYAPGGPGYKTAKSHFEKLAKTRRTRTRARTTRTRRARARTRRARTA